MSIISTPFIEKAFVLVPYLCGEIGSIIAGMLFNVGI
jgi:hypothetical protein